MGSFAQLLSEALAAPAEATPARPFADAVRAFETTLAAAPSADTSPRKRYPGAGENSSRARYATAARQRSSVAWSA